MYVAIVGGMSCRNALLFNTNGIVYDNSPWHPGSEVVVDRPISEQDERKFKNVATKITSNGVELLVKDKNANIRPDQRKLKLMHMTSMMPQHQISLAPQKSLLTSAVATFVNRQHMSALFPIHQLMQHNYIIKTCMTTYTYLTTVVHNKRSAISTFETILSVITTESLANPYATALVPEIKPTKTKYADHKTIQPSVPSNLYASNYHKIEKRIDNELNSNFDLIEPSEPGHTHPCTTSCSCSHTKTEGLKTKYTNSHHSMSGQSKYGTKTATYGSTKLDLRPTKLESLDKKTQYGPYEYESSQLAPTDRIVEKYTEVISDYSDEKDSNSVEVSELLTNEQAPGPPKNNKVHNNKTSEKPKPKPQKPNKNKVLVADLLKLGSLGIKGLSQLAPVIEKMTGGFMKRQDINKTTTTSTTTDKPQKLTAYHVNKRIDSDIDSKQSNFPIYIPVDELETAESQLVFTNATLHQNLAWAVEHKQPKAHIIPPKMVHESPLVNGGIPISPGDIITANSDVIVGKPAVGGPLTLAASGFKLHNPVNPPPIDSLIAGNEQYFIQENPNHNEQTYLPTKVDDSFDLRPPELPKPNRNPPRPSTPPFNYQNSLPLSLPHPRLPPQSTQGHNEYVMKTEHIKTGNTILGNHGRPAFLDYIPSLGRPTGKPPNSHINYKLEANTNEEIPDNSPSSSEVINMRVTSDGKYAQSNSDSINKPLLVDIQPSRVANVIIPHGSATALVFAGSSEPHKTGEYIDDPLPYPEPGYFGSFSIDAPQMTNVHNVAPTSNKQHPGKTHHPQPELYKTPPHKDQQFRNELKFKWKDNKRPIDFNKLPPPTSNQETHVQVGPEITVYNPDIYNPNNGDFEKFKNTRGHNKNKDGKEIIDKEYEKYLAVPPPPPKMHYNQENQQFENKNKPYNQRPIVHVQPVQDMKVFLNIQHPVPDAPKPDPLPPKVTSEIYFAAQAPNSKPSPTYTIQIPPAAPPFGNLYTNEGNNVNKNHYQQNAPSTPNSNSFPAVPPPNYTNKPTYSDDVNINDKDNTYTVTLNTATNVASNVGETGQVVGSSVPVAIGNIDQLNADIPIGTNFAIKVEDSNPSIDSYNLQNTRNQPVVYDENGRVPPVGDNRWNMSTSEYQRPQYETTVIGDNFYNQYLPQKPTHINVIPPKTESYKPKQEVVASGSSHHKQRVPEKTEYVNKPISIPPSKNSHANFPMMNEETTHSQNDNDIKPVTEVVNELKPVDPKRPAKLIPNYPTNSHGWYSSILQNEGAINNIKVEATTRKTIPLLPEYNKDPVPDFGQKVHNVGKPPSGYWNQNIGKPFTNPSTQRPTSSITTFNTKPSQQDYLYFGGTRQPVYDIPVRDNSDETTTIKTKPLTPVKETVKPVFENSEEIYDGEDDKNFDGDGEVSQESMKVPVITSSNEESSVKPKPDITLIKEEVKYQDASKTGQNDKQGQLVEFNPGTQTEKPFGSNNKTQTFQSNTIRPIYNMKPRPFTINSGVLDHQLQQPHWQINQLQVNSTNVSYEENLDLNIGEEMGSGSTTRPSSTPSHRYPEYDSTKYRRPQRPIFSMNHNKTRFGNESNIITSTVQINDKKPLIVEDVQAQSTSTPISLTTLNFNQASSEIMDLSPPPATIDYNFKPSTNDEMIMGMSPPPRTPSSIRPPIRTQPTPRPLPIRTPSPYRTKPPRTLPPRVSTTPRPARRPINRDEVSTYRPSYDILNSIRRPSFNQNQPSSHLLPPPREIPSKIITPFNDLPSPTISIPSVPNVVFPTPISSGWLTSSGVGFSSSFDFAPTSVLFPDASTTSRIPDSSDVSSTENSFSYYIPSSSEHIDELTSEKPVTEDRVTTSKETTTESIVYYSSSEESNVSDSVSSESSHEDGTTDKMNVVPIPSKNRTRKPYNPHRHEDKKTTPKYRLPSRPHAVTRPTKVTRPDNLYPSQTRKIVRPVPTRPSLVLPTRIIESSESSIDDDIIRPTEVLKDSVIPTVQPELTSSVSNNIASIVTPSLDDVKPTIQPTHHAGNEVKISDELVPTKTEFKTTVVTLTKTLSEPPKTISSIGYVNLTHTMTVTHTKTSLVSQSEGAITQTLVLTNTHTSTIVDVITEIHTQVQPTTIIETVTKHIPNIGPTPVQDIPLKTKTPLDDITMSSEENDNLIIKDGETTENTHKVETESEGDNETFFVVMNKSQNGGKAPPITTDIDTGEYDITRNEQVNNNGVSQVLFGEILLAGTPFLETTNVVNPTGFSKECQPDCKASRNERCQRIDGVMKCVCRPGFARMFPDRPCKPTYTYSVKLALGSQGSQPLQFHEHLADNSSKQYHALAVATHEGINRMVMQSDLRDVYHGVHITGFHPVEMKKDGEKSYQGVMNDFYVQLSDNAHESRLKEVIEKYLRNNNYSLGGTDVHAAGELVDRLDVSDFDECTSGQFHDCSEHAQCFNLRGTYTCSCQEGFADLSVNTLYPGRVCSAEPVGCERCNYHGACYSRDDRRVLCECFQWYAGGSCQINLKVVLISLVVCGVAVVALAAVCAALACRPRARPQRSVVACIQAMPALHQGAMPSKRADRRALISDRGDSGDASSIQNASLPYMPTKMQAPRPPKKHCVAPPPAHDPPPPPAPAVMIPRARLHPHHSDSRENISRKKSMEMTSVSEAKLISYLESGAAATNEEMRRKHSMESSYSMSKDKHNKQGALISAGFKVSTTIRPDENNIMIMRDHRDDMSSVNKADLEAELAHLDALRKCYSQEDLSEWTDAERRIGELTLSEARSVGGTLPASTGRAASSTRLTHQEANTMAERDLGSTFLLPHVHLYKPDLTSDVSEFDSL